MKPHPIRVYADTSVFGGAFDEEFKRPSRKFFKLVKQGQFILVTSVVVQREIAPAPRQVRSLFNRLLNAAVIASVTDEAIVLRNAYIKAGIVDERSRDDALHVGLATVSGCGLIVSWNFKHIVNYKRIPQYNEINEEYGYPAISIHSPSEVLENEG